MTNELKRILAATTSEAPGPTATVTTEPTRMQTTLQPTTVEAEQMTTNTIAPADSELRAIYFIN